jgi:ribosomal protein S6--L-glutamate ligase
MRRLHQACRELGHHFRAMDVLQAHLVVRRGSPEVWEHGERVLPTDIDVVVPRIGTTVTTHGCAVVNQFEVMGLPVVNTSEAILRARDKLRCLQHLARAGVDLPRTSLVTSPDDLDEALAEVGGLPCVLKLLQGTQGIGVMLLESREALESVLQAFWSLDHTVLLQEFVAESRGRDVRAFVVGGEVVAAMRRQARKGEFRSNIHRGGTGVPVQLDAAQREAVLGAARAMGLDIAGVDYLEGRDGPRVIEVNASPGFEGLEAATRVDVAGAIVRFAAGRAA